jgi:cytochrome c
MSRFRELAAALAIAAALASATPAVADKLGIGRAATPEEVAAWDIDVRPDGQGLPKGHGTVAQGEEIFQTQCAACHGEFGEGKDRWPVLAGGHGSLKNERPDKTVGSFWPYATTLFDYIRRAMPFGNAQSLSPDELYALTAYILFLNDVTKDQTFTLDEKTLPLVRMSNAAQFYDDDRERVEKGFWKKQPCMQDCKRTAEVLGRARVLDVTPESKTAPRVD